jgi:hypothetical protein
MNRLVAVTLLALSLLAVSCTAPEGGRDPLIPGPVLQ